MTPDEVLRDVNRFLEYLIENGVCVHSMALLITDKYVPVTIRTGSSEMLDELIVRVMAYKMGLKVIERAGDV